MSEDFVSYNIMRFLQGCGWIIVQYHPPGGQASFCINVEGGIFYPDLVAQKESMIIVAENKPRYSTSDITKLRKIMNSADAVSRITDYVREFCKNHNLRIGDDLGFYYVHGYSKKEHSDPLPDITLIYVGRDGNISVKKSTLYPFAI